MMSNRSKYFLVAGFLFFVFLALPFSHHHIDSPYEANCFAGKVENNISSYSYLFLALFFLTIISLPFIEQLNQFFVSPIDIYQLFINRAPPSPR
jgi:hypothetical protein